MNNENLKSIIYISKRCPHCRKLLLLLQNKPELKGSIQVTCVDDEPFPKIIKSVPTMISNGEIWTSEELFAALEGKGSGRGPQPGQGPQPGHGPQPGQGPQPGHGPQPGRGPQPGHGPQPGQGPQPGRGPQQGQGPVDELEGYFNSDGLGGGVLGFAPLEDNAGQVKQNYFASIDSSDHPIDVENDGYIKNNKKMNEFDNDYEKMMAERGEIGGGMRMG